MATSRGTVIHRAAERGHANHGWLDSYHTFSFADYYNRDSMHFGVLRVLNDDVVSGGEGFGKHPHENMEIITIPFDGELEHADSMGHTQVIGSRDVQVMSAGRGLMHSEYNHNKDRAVNFAQIWIFPKTRNVDPRYDQKSFEAADRQNSFQLLLSPHQDDGVLWIHQDAWFYRASMDSGVVLEHKLHDSNGAYLFVVEGTVTVNGHELNRRDGIGISDTSKITVSATSKADVILMDIPMSLETNAPRS